ncbi:class F sortase [Streptomyces sp. NPDC050504]|uniref:class F sortase n=1 Tax=Streptomyces sp. NPDC050504 TaxID=3365618 RepID=UPI0037B873A0
MASGRAKGWLIGVAVLGGVWLVQNGSETQLPPQPVAAGGAFRAGPGQHAAGTPPAADPLRPSAPVRLRIPHIGVDAPFVRLGLGRDGSLDVPPAANRNVVGWYKDGPPPGAAGTAIVAGHVDNERGKSVFYGLGTLEKGHAVEVVRKDGRTAVFTVDAVEVYENESFPDERVYGAAEGSELRVITCGGGFEEGVGYRGNVVVYAHLTAVR